MRRYAPDTSVAPSNRLDAEPDQVRSEADESKPEANRSVFVLSQSSRLFAALLRVFVLAGENLAGAFRSRLAVRWFITAVAFTILLVVVGNAYASPDKDGDGIHNSQDTCLKLANPNQADQDGDGRGDACDSDRDGDGVANTSDRCPEEPGSASNRGCPVPLPPTTCSDGQYLAEYRNEAQSFTTYPELTRCENAPLDYDWGTGSPAAGVRADNFTARYTGTFTFDSGDYKFTATTDDGMRVIVDGITIIDEWRPQSATTYTATHNLSAGSHTVAVQYFEATDSATAKVSWRKSPLDTDGDGVTDDVDECDNEPGPDSNNGCPVSTPPPDTDGDGVADDVDECDNEPGPDSNSGCPVSTPPLDTDGDGVTDDVDECDNEPGPDSNSGCPVSTPPLDTDGDGVADDVDECDNEPGPDSNNGCPVTQPPGSGLCNDAIDNDGDKKIDLGDPGCADAADNDESNPASPPIPAADSGGFVTGNTAANASTNRQAFLSLSNTCRNVTLPPGNYYVDNGASTPWVEIQHYCGTFAFEEGARLYYVDSDAGGVRFRYGTGAKFINWESYHPATYRGNPMDNFSLYNTTDSYIDSMFVNGGNVGIMPWLAVRPTIVNSHAQNTFADGLHLVASSGATVRDWSAYNTGDDGLSFQTYTEQYPVSSGTADGVTVINGKTRGITVLGSQDITISNFVVRNSWTSGLYVACESNYNDCAAKPVRNVLFQRGKVYDAGRHSTNGTGPNPDSITVWRSPNDNIRFSDIQSVTPLRDCFRAFDGGSATLTNVVGDGTGC